MPRSDWDIHATAGGDARHGILVPSGDDGQLQEEAMCAYAILRAYQLTGEHFGYTKVIDLI